MSTGKWASYPWYVRDFMADTMTLGLDERGAYRDLMDYQWLHGAVPEDAKTLAAIWRVPPGRARKLWTVVSRYFPEGSDGARRNRRLERERAKVEARTEAARRNAEARWGQSGGNADAMQPHSGGNASRVRVRGTNKPSVQRGGKPTPIGDLL